MGPDNDTAVAAYVGDCQEGPDRCVPDVGQFVGGGNGFARALQSCVHFGGIAFALRGGAPFVVANGFGEVVAAGESGPFGGRKDGDEIALTTCAVGYWFLSSAPTEIRVEPNVAGRTIRA